MSNELLESQNTSNIFSSQLFQTTDGFIAGPKPDHEHSGCSDLQFECTHLYTYIMLYYTYTMSVCMYVCMCIYVYIYIYILCMHRCKKCLCQGYKINTLCNTLCNVAQNIMHIHTCSKMSHFEPWRFNRGNVWLRKGATTFFVG